MLESSPPCQNRRLSSWLLGNPGPGQAATQRPSREEQRRRSRGRIPPARPPAAALPGSRSWSGLFRGHRGGFAFAHSQVYALLPRHLGDSLRGGLGASGCGSVGVLSPSSPARVTGLSHSASAALTEPPPQPCFFIYFFFFFFLFPFFLFNYFAPFSFILFFHFIFLSHIIFLFSFFSLLYLLSFPFISFLPFFSFLLSFLLSPSSLFLLSFLSSFLLHFPFIFFFFFP